MCLTSNILAVVLCMLVICGQYVYIFTEDITNVSRVPNISLRGNFVEMQKHGFYFGPGEAAEIFCTGRAAENLSLSYALDDSGPLPSEIINKTTIRLLLKKRENEETYYYYLTCQSVDEFGLSSSSTITLMLDEKVDSYDFSCISKKLTWYSCSWRTTNIAAGFRLHLNDQIIKPCGFPVVEIKRHRRSQCEWNMTINSMDIQNTETLHFVLENCNFESCWNKTYDIDLLSILKLDKPRIKQITEWREGSHNTVTKGVSLVWQIPDETLQFLDGIDHKVQYRFIGTENQRRYDINTKLVRVLSDNSYELNFELPCFNRDYEIFVSVKTKQSANSKRYWPNYATVGYRTDSNSEELDIVDDVMCAELDGNKESPQIMLYLLKEFKEEEKRVYEGTAASEKRHKTIKRKSCADGRTVGSYQLPVDNGRDSNSLITRRGSKAK